MIALSFLLSLSVCLLWTGAEGQSNGDLRLVARDGRTSSSLTAGRLEVYYSGEWGTVCDDNFGATAARIACNQLGFADGYYNYETIGSSFSSLFSASSSAEIWLDSFSCFGSESRLIDCARGTIGNMNCAHSEDIALYCVGDGALRLSDDLFGFYSSGRLEVYYRGQWGTVCNDFFGQTEANVACQQLGYYSALNYGRVGDLGYNQGSGTIWLDNVDCTSSELMLSSCSHNGFGNGNCFHYKDVALSCSTFNTSIFTTAVIVGIVIAVVVPLCCIGICVTVIVIAVCTGACAAGAASSRGRRRNVNVTTTTTPAATTAVVATTGSTTNTTAPGFAPQAGYTPYPADFGKKEMQQYPGDPAYPPQPAPPYSTSGYAPVNP